MRAAIADPDAERVIAKSTSARGNVTSRLRSQPAADLDHVDLALTMRSA
jgi:hypothetical protein